MKQPKLNGPLKIVEGMTLVCDTLRWDAGWEFECPSMMLSPTIRCFENGHHHEEIVESVLISAMIDEQLVTEDFEKTWGWRGYKLPVLRRRFKEALAGKKFPIAGYVATRETVKIIRDKKGELTWIRVPSVP